MVRPARPLGNVASAALLVRFLILTLQILERSGHPTLQLDAVVRSDRFVRPQHVLRILCARIDWSGM
jgi:hypothetical protein